MPRLASPIRTAIAMEGDLPKLMRPLTISSITPKISPLLHDTVSQHDDPANRLIVSSALQGPYPLITGDEKLRAIPKQECSWQT